MRQTVSIMLLNLLFCSYPLHINAAEPIKQSPEAKVLARLLGTWEVDTVFKSAKWTPDKKRLKETKIAKSFLGGHFIQESIRSDEVTGHAICHYDSQKKKYQSWYFNSKGNKSEWTGTWDEKTSTMTWSSDFGIGVVGRGVTQFSDADNYTLKFIVKSKEGELLLDIHAEHKRKQKKK